MKEPNQAEALRLAGSKSKGTNLETSASRMSSNVKVKAYMVELSKRAESRAEKKAKTEASKTLSKPQLVAHMKKPQEKGRILSFVEI